MSKTIDEWKGECPSLEFKFYREEGEFVAEVSGTLWSENLKASKDVDEAFSCDDPSEAIDYILAFLDAEKNDLDQDSEGEDEEDYDIPDEFLEE